MAQSVSRRDFVGAVGSAAEGLSMMSKATAEPKPNLLFILTDQQRQDGVGCYGKKGIITPNLDRLASDGMRFDRAYAAQPVCAPNRGTIFSGLYPHNHGVLENTLGYRSRNTAFSRFPQSCGISVCLLWQMALGRPRTRRMGDNAHISPRWPWTRALLHHRREKSVSNGCTGTRRH